MRYALWLCRAKYYICSPPIRIPSITYCISKPAVWILNCTLTTQTVFQKGLFVFFILFRHLKSETNYGTRTIFSFSFFSFNFLYLRPIFAFRKRPFCIPTTPLCIHKLGFNIPNTTLKFKTDFLLLKKRYSTKLQSFISNSNTVF